MVSKMRVVAVAAVAASLSGCLAGCMASGSVELKGSLPFLGPFEWHESADNWNRSFDPSAWSWLYDWIGQPADGESPPAPDRAVVVPGSPAPGTPGGSDLGG